MGQRRRSAISSNAGSLRRQEVMKAPADITKDQVLKSLLSDKAFGLSEQVACSFINPHSLATLLGRFDTQVPGVVGPSATYNIDLASIGFTANAKYLATPAELVVQIVKGANTYSVSVDSTDTFSAAASPGGAIVLGVCSINRANGTLQIVTDTGTDDLSGASTDWELTAFITEGERSVTGAAQHGAGWDTSVAIFRPRRGVIEIPHVDSAGTPVATKDQTRVYFQSIVSSSPFANNNFQAAVLISPFHHLRDNAKLYYHLDDDARKVADPDDAGWTALPWDDLTDLAGDTLLYTSQIQAAALGASTRVITLKLELLITPTRSESTFIYGFAVGVN